MKKILENQLIESCKKNNILYVKALLENSEYDININIKDNDKNTPLLVSLYNNNPQITELLLSKKADITIKNQYGFNILMIASKIGHHRIVKKILDLDKKNPISIIDDKNIYDKTALYIAVQYKNNNCINELIKYGANPLVKCNDTSMIYQAIITNNYKIIELILDRAAENFRKIIGIHDCHQLIYASINGNYMTIKTLLDNTYMYQHINDKILSKALIHTSKRNYVSIIKLIYGYGGDLLYKNHENNTSLIYACMKNKLRNVKYILDTICSKNSDRDIIIQYILHNNNYGLSAIDISMSYSDREIFTLLMLYFPEDSPPFKYNTNNKLNNYDKYNKINTYHK